MTGKRVTGKPKTKSESRPIPVHHSSIVAGFETARGELVIAGVPVGQLTRRIGSTPYFVYDRARISRRIAELRSALPKRVGISYAMKANPMPAVVQHIAPLVDGLDVASAGELAVALDTPMPASRISFAGPGKRPEELARAIAAGITINVESERELEVINDIARQQKSRAQIALRINPDFELKASGMRMGGGARQFGIDSEQAPGILHRLRRQKVDFHGFHIFAGSQCLNAETLADTQAQTLALALELAANAPCPVQHINMGGGLGIPYFPGDTPLDLKQVGASLGRLTRKHATALKNIRLSIELGRYIVGEAGVYICRVVDRKISRGEVFLVTDGGLHHQLAASGNFGQVLRRNYPVAVATKMGRKQSAPAHVVGCLCTPLDLIGNSMALAHADVGDLIAVFQSGAYGLTASPTRFLSHPEPAEALV